MFDVLDELEDVIGKLLASEPTGDVVRVLVLAERLEFARLREIGAYDRSCEWAADGFVSTASALRSKCRSTHGRVQQAVELARKLDRLPETAAAFSAGEITREHAAVLARPCTPERAEMIDGIERELVDFARISNPNELRGALERMTDAFDGDGGARSDEAEHELNRVTLSATLNGRGMLNGSLDAELTDLAQTAFNAEMEVLRRPGETRTVPQLRADALASICRQYLASRGASTARGRGQTHISIVQDLAQIEKVSPQLAADIRAETANGGLLSRTTLERLACDCNISRIITDGPSQVLDVGRMTRAISAPLWNALVARDRHCTEPGCNRPPGMCEAHHVWHWEHGGPTNLANLKLLCWYHHRQQHINDAQQHK